MDIRANAAEYSRFYRNTLLEDVMPFWMNSDLLDEEHGGCITSVDREGKTYNSDKSVWFQGRCLWTFSALCRRYGEKPKWRHAADLAKSFLDTYCVDTDGRMFFTVTKEGRPLRKRRYMFSESFYVVGMAEYGAAFGDAQALEKAQACFETMLMLYRTPEKDPYAITPKVYAETRSEQAAAVPMVLVSSAQILRRCVPEREAYYSAIVREVAQPLLTVHYHPELKCVLETVLADGSYTDTPAGRTVNPGHSCENSWFLMNQAVVSGDKDLLAQALNILDWSLDIGWDKEFGGIYAFVDAKGYPCEPLEWDMKLWWVHNEALIATLMAYGLTGERKYWDWFERIHDYTFAHFSDKEYGEWYGYLHRDGTVSHAQKGSQWKGPYHLPRCLMICEQLLSCIADGKAIEPVL